MKISESKLATHFVESLTDCHVYKEVPCGGIIDIVTLNGNIITSFEAKTSFSFDVIEQAVKNKTYAHYSYVLIPRIRTRSFAYQVCKDNGIGVIEIDCSRDILGKPVETLKPLLNRKICKPKLCDWQKENTAGVQNGRITAFSNTVTCVTNYLKSRHIGGKCEAKKLLNDISHHYGSNTSALSSLMNMVRQGVIKDFYFDKGLIILNNEQ